MNMSTGTRTRRVAAMVAVLVTIGASAACAPPPESSIFEGGTFPVEIQVESQSVTTEFDVFLAHCSVTTTTPEVDIRGTVTVAPAELSPSMTSVVIPGASVEIPASRVSVGSVSLTCDGQHVATVGVALEFSASASVQSAVLEVSSGSLTLTDPTVSITDAQARFTGAASNVAPVQLPPITVTVPTITIPGRGSVNPT